MGGGLRCFDGVEVRGEGPEKCEQVPGGGLVFKALRWLYHSTPGSRAIKKKEEVGYREGLVQRFGVPEAPRPQLLYRVLRPRMG